MNAVAEEVSTLAILSPDREAIDIAGEMVMVEPLKVGALGSFSKSVKALSPALKGAMDGDGGVDVMELVSEHADDLISAVAIGCNRDAAWVADLGIEDFVKLAGKVMVVNMDFFAQRLPQLTDTVVQSIEALTPTVDQETDGTTPSSG